LLPEILTSKLFAKFRDFPREKFVTKAADGETFSVRAALIVEWDRSLRERPT
jgi:hypothetical protein